MGFYFCDQDLDGDQSVLLRGPGRRHCLARMSPNAPTGTEWPQWSHGLQLENKCRDNVSVHAKSHWEITQKCHWHITKLREDFVISRVIFQFIFWTILYINWQQRHCHSYYQWSGCQCMFVWRGTCAVFRSWWIPVEPSSSPSIPAHKTQSCIGTEKIQN